MWEYSFPSASWKKSKPTDQAEYKSLEGDTYET